MKTKNIKVDLTGVSINHLGRDVTLNQVAEGRTIIPTNDLLRGNQYQKEKVLSKLN